MRSLSLPRYAELHCLSNFSFLKGASHPEELVGRAIELGYAGLAITDECSLAGVVRAHGEAKNTSLHLIIGSSFVLDDGLRAWGITEDPWVTVAAQSGAEGWLRRRPVLRPIKRRRKRRRRRQ